MKTLRQSNNYKITNLKSFDEVKEKGQFETPGQIARMMVKASEKYFTKSSISILEPSMGSGSLVSACLEELPKNFSFHLTGIELDEDFFKFAHSFFCTENINVVKGDFLRLVPDQQYDFVIANPPYTRHHMIHQLDKFELQKQCREETGISVSGLSGLYIYFILLADKWLKHGSVSCWIIPQEFLSVNYGSALREYLTSKVNLKRIHLFNYSSTLFSEALVSSCIVWFTKEDPDNQKVEITTGSDCSSPEHVRYADKQELSPSSKWTFSESNPGSGYTLGDFFSVKRGIASGDNDFFIVNLEEIRKYGLSYEYLTPILPSPRYLKESIIYSDEGGNPSINNPLYLINTTLPPKEIQSKYPELWKYLEMGIGTVSEKYLCKKRKQWYFQEKRQPPLFLCPYFSRKSKAQNNSTFKPILNFSKAIGSNSYLLLYPKDNLKKILSKNPDYAFKLLGELEKINLQDIEEYGRKYGGGLNKLEPKELPKIPCSNLLELA